MSGLRGNCCRNATGFTLVELIVVVAVVAILAAIATPSFLDQMRKGRRSEAMSVLQSVAQLQERWRANNPLYATVAELGGALPTSAYYSFAVQSNTARTYVLRATATGAQAADSACATMELTNAGVRTPAVCWSR